MRKLYMKTRNMPRHARTALRGALASLALCAALRLCGALGADTAAEELIGGIVSRGGIADGIMRFELGMTPVPSAPGAPPGAVSAPETVPATDGASGEGSNSERRPYLLAPYIALPDAEAPPEDPPEDPAPPTPPEDPPRAPGPISVNNMTQYDIDVPALMAQPLEQAPGSAQRVLILHTHGSEAYTPDGDDVYEPSDPYRTEDRRYSIIRVGDELASCLEELGFSVIHDTGIYDHPSYQGSYGRSDAVIASYQERYPDISLIIDLHRDAISAPDGSQYKTVANIGDGVCSQIMFFVGSDSAGLYHPKWRENFKLALRVQSEMDALYPSLARPIYLSQYRYNQHRSQGSLLVEVGSAGNTLEESLTAIRYFADAYARAVMSPGAGDAGSAKR
ncbi:MAG: stage II sporulation protein P [Oscillospiraceae bacterium]|jgi:stage II sporulation protein P|nr:stage II sporulation protein P [Oscillospiraceae bacterium]